MHLSLQTDAGVIIEMRYYKQVGKRYFDLIHEEHSNKSTNPVGGGCRIKHLAET